MLPLTCTELIVCEIPSDITLKSEAAGTEPVSSASLKVSVICNPSVLVAAEEKTGGTPVGVTTFEDTSEVLVEPSVLVAIVLKE